MGTEVEREDFTGEDYALFARRLRRNLAQLRELLAQPGFGAGETTFGAEVEMHLVDADARPACINQAVLARTSDPRCTLEIDAFNFEVNSRPTPLTGAGFSALDRELAELFCKVRTAAAESGARVVLVGTLPTLTSEQLQGPVLTDAPRYRAMSKALRDKRGEPFAVHIVGRETLQTACHDLTLEGANASLQVHLRVAPGAFADVYNAAQLAAAPLLAVSGNSPFFDGKCLWEETRIALFKQATDTRSDIVARLQAPARVTFGRGFISEAFDLFEENVTMYEPILPVVSMRDSVDSVPALDELRLHQGTIWNWNRAVYDPAGGGHLRIEHRVVPSGPTRIDMLANAAFTLGLSLGLAPLMAAWTPAFPFRHAEHNLYRAAQLGLDAELAWPSATGCAPQLWRARDLVLDCSHSPRARCCATASMPPPSVSSWASFAAERRPVRLARPCSARGWPASRLAPRGRMRWPACSRNTCRAPQASCPCTPGSCERRRRCSSPLGCSLEQRHRHLIAADHGVLVRGSLARKRRQAGQRAGARMQPDAALEQRRAQIDDLQHGSHTRDLQVDDVHALVRAHGDCGELGQTAVAHPCNEAVLVGGALPNQTGGLQPRRLRRDRPQLHPGLARPRELRESGADGTHRHSHAVCATDVLSKFGVECAQRGQVALERRPTQRTFAVERVAGATLRVGQRHLHPLQLA
jgi:hypothetical protein